MSLDEDDDRIRRVLEVALEFAWQVHELKEPDGVLQWRRRVAEMHPDWLAAIEVLRGMIDTAEFSHPMLAWWPPPPTEAERTDLVMAVPRDQAPHVPLSAERYQRELDRLVGLANRMLSASLSVAESRKLTSPAGAEKAALRQLALALKSFAKEVEFFDKHVASLATAAIGRDVTPKDVRNSYSRLGGVSDF